MIRGARGSRFKARGLPDDELRHIAPGPDPVLSVRTEVAACRLETVFAKSGGIVKTFAELKQRYLSNLDRPESHLSLGILAENRTNP